MNRLENFFFFKFYIWKKKISIIIVLIHTKCKYDLKMLKNDFKMLKKKKKYK